jgi:CRP/FNR family transcriptional regulator
MERPVTARLCADCTTCAVHISGFAAGFSAADAQQLDRAKVAHYYRRGQTLFYEGNPCTAVFCLRSALVRVIKTAPHGRRHLLALAGPGDLLGLEAAVSGAPYDYGAEILRDGQVCLIERAPILQLIEAYPSLRDAALRQLATDVRHAQVERAQLASGDARERTAHVLLELGQRFGEAVDGRLLVRLPLSREDLADMIGVAVETAIRQISDLRRRGIVTTARGALVIEDADRLARLARTTPGTP